MVLNVKTKRFVLTITIQLGASVNNLRKIVKVKFVNKKSQQSTCIKPVDNLQQI